MSGIFVISTDGEVALHPKAAAQNDRHHLKALVAQWQFAVQEEQRLKRCIRNLQMARQHHGKSLGLALEAAAAKSLKTLRSLEDLPPSSYWYRLEGVSAGEWQSLKAAPLEIPSALAASFSRGDTLAVYAKGHGLVGIATVTATGKAEWLATAPRVARALKASELRNQFGIKYPRQEVELLSVTDISQFAYRLQVMFENI